MQFIYRINYFDNTNKLIFNFDQIYFEIISKKHTI
jgi:hypothetical protein